MSKWISVDFRFPDMTAQDQVPYDDIEKLLQSKEVIAFNGKNHLCSYMLWEDIDKNTLESGFYSDSIEDYLKDVTAWQESPEPPIKEPK